MRPIETTTALGGSLIAVGDPAAGIALLGVALASTVTDELVGTSIGRRLTPERASQNVLAASPSTAPRLIVTVNYDAGRTGLITGRRSAPQGPASTASPGAEDRAGSRGSRSRSHTSS